MSFLEFGADLSNENVEHANVGKAGKKYDGYHCKGLPKAASDMTVCFLLCVLKGCVKMIISGV